MSKPFEAMGRSVGEHLDEFPQAPQLLERARGRFLQAAEWDRSRAGSWFLRRRGAVAIAAGMLSALVAAFVFRLAHLESQRPVTALVESSDAPLVGQWVSAHQETKRLRFSDGTRLSMHPETTLRIEEARATGATISLARGRTLAHVEPKPGASWRFQAGPFLIVVTGTEFDLAWDAESGILELALYEGAVTLSGPTLQGERAVQKGDFVRLSVPGSFGSAGGPEAPTTELSPEDAPPLDPEQPNAPGEPAAPPSQTTAPQKERRHQHRDEANGNDVQGESSTRARADWETLLSSGETSGAIRAIETSGRARVLGAASPEQLWSITRAARLRGHPELARDALLELRKKHGIRGESSYLLGKVHADQLRATAKAISWFELYLKEAPNGPLAEQAMGRLVELQAGGAAAERSARRYLERFPAGSYAAFARSQLP